MTELVIRVSATDASGATATASVTVNVGQPEATGLAADLRHALGSARTEMDKIAERM